MMGWLFDQADKDKNGTIDKQELQEAMQKLGFDWMDEKRIDKFIKKADDNKDEVLQYEEFAKTSPKFLKQSLLKLAKKNGADLVLELVLRSLLLWVGVQEIDIHDAWSASF